MLYDQPALELPFKRPLTEEEQRNAVLYALEGRLRTCPYCDYPVAVLLPSGLAISCGYCNSFRWRTAYDEKL